MKFRVSIEQGIQLVKDYLKISTVVVQNFDGTRQNEYLVYSYR